MGKKEAVAKLEVLTASGAISCKTIVEDQYGRKVASCFAGTMNVGYQMVRTGYAWAFVQHSDAFIAAEKLARSEQIGIWQGPSVNTEVNFPTSGFGCQPVLSWLSPFFGGRPRRFGCFGG